MTLRNALTIDVEDYFQVSAFEKYTDRADWDGYPSRVVANTQRILRLLEEAGVRGTFFILGWVAERFPALVCEIQAAGHEIASHGYWHRLVYQMSPEEFRDDLIRSREVLGTATGMAPTAYRAPSFSITRRSLWALDVLAEQGFRYDSSIFPIYHDRYGIPDALPMIHRIDRPGGSLWEFPVSVARVGPLNLPVSGGGYFRAYPFWLTHRLLKRINRKHRRPFVFYLHPWEVDPDQPRLAVHSWRSRTRHYLNLTSTERKLRRLLECFSFGTLSEVVDAHSKNVECHSTLFPDTT